MDSQQPPSFDVRLDDPTETLVIGTAEYGLAGLTATDYLTKQLELEEAGHIRVDGLPAITPFDNGTPRRHTRLFSRSDLDLTVLVGELPIPPFAAASFADAIATTRRSTEPKRSLSSLACRSRTGRTITAPFTSRPSRIASPDWRGSTPSHRWQVASSKGSTPN